MRQQFLKFKAESSEFKVWSSISEFRVQGLESSTAEINEQGLYCARPDIDVSSSSWNSTSFASSSESRERFTTTEISFSQGETYSSSLSFLYSSSKETDTMGQGNAYFNL